MTWTRARVATFCGRCRRLVGVGDPLLQLQLTTTITKVRCVDCAGPAPPDLPTLVVSASAAPPLDMTRVGLLSLDFSRKTTKED
jgi:hypothetical protein